MIAVSSVSASTSMRGEETPQPVGAHAKLAGRLLARDVQAPPGRDDARGKLEHQRGLADPRLPAHEDRRAAHETAAEHAVHLRDAGVQPHAVARLDGGERDRRGRPSSPSAIAPAAARLRRRSADGDFRESVPRSAFGASSEPARLLVAASRALEDRFCLRHSPARVGGAVSAVNRGYADLVLSARDPHTMMRHRHHRT